MLEHELCLLLGTDLTQCPRNDSLNDSSSLLIQQMHFINDQELQAL
jgi:hypothetical protein